MTFRTLVLLCIATLLAACENKDTLRLNLNNVTVTTQRETSGDRPYFNTILFRSTFNRAGSTQVELYSREPNDWVSKSQYNGGTLPNGHMQVGDRLNIPWWMGEIEWRNLNIVPLRDIFSTPPEVVGAVVVSLDNNNTPPHVIRDIMGDVTGIMRGAMLSQIEQGEWLMTLTDPLSFFQTLLDVVTAEVGALDLAGYLLQLTIGSTFNPDQPTGMEIFLIPGVEGLTVPLSTSLTVPGLPGGPVTVRLTILPTSDATRSTNFTGSGATYAVNTTIDRERYENNRLTTSNLQLSLKTGNDDMRGGGQINVTLSVCEGGSLVTRTFNNVNGGAERPRWDDSTFTLALAANVGSIKSMTINWSPGGGISPDNWDIEAIKLGYRAGTTTGTYFVRQGAPVIRMTNDLRSWSFRFDATGCS